MIKKECTLFVEDLIPEIDATIDQLIENAEAMQGRDLSQFEKDALEKTQESLLAHMLHTDEKLAEKRKSLKKPNPKTARYQIQEKLLRFTKLNENLVKNLPFKLGLRKKKSRLKKVCKTKS